MKDCKPVDLADSHEMRHLLESYEFQIPVSNGQMVQDKGSSSDSGGEKRLSILYTL